MLADTKDLKTAQEIVSYDPATNEILGSVQVRSIEEIREYIKDARRIQPAWAASSFKDRGQVVMRARQIILEELDQIAELISRETGKPITEAISMEIAPVLDLMQFFARKSSKLLKAEKLDIGQYGLMGRSSKIIYRPIGVIGIISPWNFPLAIPLGEVVMALMAGNTVILKPSELTPLVGLKIGEIFERAGLAKGLLTVATGNGGTGAALIEAGVDKIMFTGSVATGRRVAEAAARRLIPVLLELGGKDPMIVFEDVDVGVVAKAAVWGAFANAGQACASVERCYVHERIAPQFIEEVVKETRKLQQKLGKDEDSDIGAMSSERQLSVVEAHVQDALLKGAKVLTGGERVSTLPGAFYRPTVLTEVNQSMDIMREETFGPVLPIMTFKTEDEAINLANDSIFGLTGSVWTKDIGRGQRVASKLEAGTVMINEVLYTHAIAQTPWGGMKQSGIGRTHGRLGLLELVVPQHIHTNRIFHIPDLWWFNYTSQARELFKGFARHFATGSVFQTSIILNQIMRRLAKLRKK
jgi:acyl-CoA reductase-like NAD-dependent aldehyde dehydrogenase